MIDIIKHSDDIADKEAAWKQLLKQAPGNEELRYIIEHTDKKDAAWEQLLKQDPTNAELRYVIKYTDKKILLQNSC